MHISGYKPCPMRTPQPEDDALESIRRHYRMDSREIHFFRFLLEAYEGIAVLTTLNRASGLVTLSIAPGREAEANRLVRHLQKEILIEPTPEGSNIEF